MNTFPLGIKVECKTRDQYNAVLDRAFNETMGAPRTRIYAVKSAEGHVIVIYGDRNTIFDYYLDNTDLQIGSWAWDDDNAYADVTIREEAIASGVRLTPLQMEIIGIINN